MTKNYTLIISSFMIASLAIVSYIFLDKDIAYFFHNNIDGIIKSIFLFITKFGESQYYLIPALAIYLLVKNNIDIKRKALFIFSSVAISGILINLIKITVARYRPAMLFDKNLYGFKWFDIGHMVNSFPSGHSTTALGAFVGFALIFPKYRYIFIFIGILIAFSRTVLTAHYFSDILIGGLIGGLTSYILYIKLVKNYRTNLKE